MALLPVVGKTLTNVDCPLLSGAVPSVTAPFKKVTEPVGVPPDGAATDAVKLTVWLTAEGFGDDTSVMTVAAGFTSWLNASEVLDVKFESPEYTAVMELLPAAPKVFVRVACPLLLSVTVPSAVVPSRKLTVPVGVPPKGDVKVAIKLTV
jgi:hypothetical protein